MAATPEKLNKIEELWVNCQRCDLSKSRDRVVFWRGDPDASVMVIGEAPGKHEDETGKPFVGRAGRLLDALCAEAGLADRERIIINAIGCRPPDNRRPTPGEWNRCSHRAYSLVSAIKPRSILLLGAFALQSFLGENKIGEWSGLAISVKIPYDKDVVSIPAVATYHPSYLLRCNSDEIRDRMLRDIRVAVEISKKD